MDLEMGDYTGLSELTHINLIVWVIKNRESFRTLKNIWLKRAAVIDEEAGKWNV